MFKRILSTLLIVALVVGVSSAVASAVTGSFTVHISLAPQTRAEEKVPFDIDFEFILDLKFTVSGLTFSFQNAMGVTGIEHAVFNLEANLGALTVHDDFVFATPFSCAPADKAPTATLFGDVANSFCGWGVGPIGSLLFVKKRVQAVISLGGITLDNLAMFEDVNFSTPTWFGGYYLYDQAVAETDDVDGDGVYDQNDQAFRFGDILKVSGETPSGIKITSIAAFNASPAELPVGPLIFVEQGWNCVKKKCWDGTVREQVEPDTTGAIAKLFFFKEDIIVENIRIGALRLDMLMTFLPTGIGPSFGWTTIASIDIPPIGNLRIVYDNDMMASPVLVGILDDPSGYTTRLLLTTAVGQILASLDSHFNIRRLRIITDLSLDPAPARLRLDTRFRWDVKYACQVGTSTTIIDTTTETACTAAPPAGLGGVVRGRELISRGFSRFIVTLTIDLGGGASLRLYNCFGSTFQFTQFSLYCLDKPSSQQSGEVSYQFAWVTLTARAGAFGVTLDSFWTLTGLTEAKIILTLNF